MQPEPTSKCMLLDCGSSKELSDNERQQAIKACQAQTDNPLLCDCAFFACNGGLGAE